MRVGCVCVCVFICCISLHSIATVAAIASLVAQRVKEPTRQCRRHKRCRFNPWVRKILGRREWQPTPEFLESLMDRGAW